MSIDRVKAVNLPGLCSDGTLRYVLPGRAVLAHVPLGVTVNGREAKVGDEVFAGDIIAYSPLVLESGGQDLSFEFTLDEEPEK